MQPLAIDLYCGLGGWTEGLLAEGYRQKAALNTNSKPTSAMTDSPRYGEYKTAAAWYASDEWLDVVRASLDEHRTCLASALRIGNIGAVQFYAAQVAACERELGLVSNIQHPASNSSTTAQQSLFDSLLKS